MSFYWSHLPRCWGKHPFGLEVHRHRDLLWGGSMFNKNFPLKPTSLKINILNLKKHPTEKENNLTNLHFWVPCEFSREGKHLRFILLKCDLPFFGRMFVLHGRDPLTQPSFRVRSFEQPKHEHLCLIHQSCSSEETGKSKEFFLFQWNYLGQGKRCITCNFWRTRLVRII